MYIKCTLEEQIKRASGFFPVVLVTGPRQVGKTTVLKNCEPGIGKNYETVHKAVQGLGKKGYLKKIGSTREVMYMVEE